MKRRRTAALLACLLAAGFAAAQGSQPPLVAASARIALAGGLGVSLISAPDVVALANATPGAIDRLADFKSAVEFFGTGSIPLSAAWVLKLEYAYLLASYNVSTTYGTGVAEYTLTVHLPSAVLQYVLVAQPYYELKAGLGVGYHTGSLSRRSFALDDTFAAGGPSLLLDIEGDTAVSDHLFVFLDAALRWDRMGALTDARGRDPALQGQSATLHLFGPGAKIGVAYLF
jgi:hypothetical protein